MLALYDYVIESADDLSIKVGAEPLYSSRLSEYLARCA